VLVAFAVVLVCGAIATAAVAVPQQNPPKPLHILVTNDDGVAAPGIATVVDALQAMPNVDVRVVAPATNQSGTGANFSTTPLTVTPATTASGDPATAVNGFPADSVLYDVLAANDHPDVVVSGINFGQNLGNITELSGTVGAARTANQLGIPAIAASQGFGTPLDYPTGARLVVAVVETFRQDYVKHSAPAQTINLNIPSCAAGTSVRGVQLLPLGQSSKVTGYTPQSGTIGNGVFAPVVTNENPITASDCASAATSFTDDIQAFANGFATATVVNQNLGDPNAFGPPNSSVWDGINRRFTG
jgi:5'-nucleotidase